MKHVTPDQMKPENDVQAALRADGLNLQYYVKTLKARLRAMETKVFHNKDIIPGLKECPACKAPKENKNVKKCKLCKGTGYIIIDPVIYSKNLKAWSIREQASQDLGQHWGAESAAESKANVTIEVVTFKKGDCRETNAE